MVERDIDYLLKRYPPHKKAEGEIWSTESRKKEQQEYRLKQRLFLFDCLNNQQLKLQGTSKVRAKELIKKINFKMGTLSEEQIIIMIMLYVKLKEGKRFQQYEYILNKNGLTLESFINFLIHVK